MNVLSSVLELQKRFSFFLQKFLSFTSSLSSLFESQSIAKNVDNFMIFISESAVLQVINFVFVPQSIQMPVMYSSRGFIY